MRGARLGRSGPLRTAAVVASGAALLYSVPFLLHLSSARSGPRIDPSKPLKQEAVRRGAFNNSGSLDAGPDPNWVDGRFVRQRGAGGAKGARDEAP